MLFPLLNTEPFVRRNLLAEQLQREQHGFEIVDGGGAVAQDAVANQHQVDVEVLADPPDRESPDINSRETPHSIVRDDAHLTS